MKSRKKIKQSYRQQISHIRNALIIEIILTICITATVIMSVWSNLYHESQQYASEVTKDYQAIIDHYVKVFNIMLVPIEEKLDENPSFDEMQTWLQARESSYQEALSSDVYDGIAFTYKDGYVHSWDYGDYSDYDPNTRPWYQQAQKANGQVTVVAPYVTFLDTSYLNENQYVVMTIAQKYTDEISFDLDLKVKDIENLLVGRELIYSNEQIFLYDPDGYILSSTDSNYFAHNVYTSDELITEKDVLTYTTCEKKTDHLQFSIINGELQYLYFHKDANGNMICMMFPFVEVFFRNFLPMLILAICMILFEIYLYRKNRKSTTEFHDRDLRLTALANAAYSQKVYIDIDDLTFHGNLEAAKLCNGNKYVELYKKFMDFIIDDGDREKFEKFLAAYVLRREYTPDCKIQSMRFAMKWKMEDGSMQNRIIEISKLPFRADEQKMVGIACNDVTESAENLKDALRQAESASEAKGSFLSNMSHEIRTPLNAIIGYLTIARDRDITFEKLKHCIDNSEVAARHLLQIINDILDMSSIENGKLKIAREEFDLKKEITDITTIFYQNAKQKNVRFETHVDELEHEWMIGDQLRLNQILMNLLSNAVKFTPENGQIHLRIKQLSEDEKQVYVQFEVSDTGIGMSKEYMSRLFQPFEQENASTARKYGGSGLGLSITNNLIRMMGGSINVKSEQNIGTTFTVTMHFELSKEHQNPKLRTADYSNVRVLVVDDEQDEGAFVKTMLKRCGVKADSVTSGMDAIKRLKGRLGGDYSYDLCILDWNMPEMNGVEVTKTIRKELGSEIPIIIATAYDINAFEEEATAAGVNKVVAKPLFQSTLFDLLVSTFGKYDPAADQEDEAVKIDMSGVHIILAEDNEMNMEIAVTILEKAGVQVDQATNGEEAYTLFMNAPAETYDMILMDIQMPVLNGYEATRKIRESNHPEAKDIPIIAMTANAFAEDVSEALANGMNAHIAKPINYDKLFQLLKKFSR